MIVKIPCLGAINTIWNVLHLFNIHLYVHYKIDLIVIRRVIENKK